ncbi:carboxypeptidase-like regulatory domain-containing protein, partial [Algoriphagus sp.]
MKSYILLLTLVFCSFHAFSQGIIRGKITNPVNNQPVAFANVLVLGTELGAVSNENGLYEINNVPTGL